MGFDGTGKCSGATEEAAVDALGLANPAFQGITMDLLKEKGWARLECRNARDVRAHANGNFLTPSGKCEFKASMAAGGNFVLPLFRQGSNEFEAGANRSIRCQPTYYLNESPATNARLAAKYPLNIIFPKSHAFLNSSRAVRVLNGSITTNFAPLFLPRR